MIIHIKTSEGYVKIPVNRLGNKVDVENNLTSTATDKALSANMGKELDNKINSLQTNVDELAGKVIGKRTALTPLFENRGAVFNDSTGYYELNGILDIHEAEMMNIYNESNRWTITAGLFSYSSIRTCFQPQKTTVLWFSNATAAINQQNFFRDATNLITVNVCPFGVEGGGLKLGTNSSTIFYNCRSLRDVFGILNASDTTSFGTSPFYNCVQLSNINIFGIKCSVSIGNSSKLTTNSILYMIKNSVTTTAITITLHATAYARAIVDADIITALSSKPLITLVSA